MSTNLQIFFSSAFGKRTKQPPLFSVIASRGVGGLDVVFVLFIEQKSGMREYRKASPDQSGKTLLLTT